MKKLLHIIATPRGNKSRTLSVSGVFLDAFLKANPGWIVDELDLSREILPSLTAKRTEGKYELLHDKELDGDVKDSWQEILSHISRFMLSNAYLISTPMWNFGIPYVLKHYIDVIVQPKYLFKYTSKGVEGLVKDRRMIIITSSGGDYSLPEFSKADFMAPYLRFVFGFVGITDLKFINAQPMDMGEEMQGQRIKSAQEQARMMAAKF